MIKQTLITALLLMVMMASCKEDPIPKPRAYARIELPTQVYGTTDIGDWDCPYSFEYSNQSVLTVDPRYQDSTCWYNLYYPRLKATIHLTYTPVRNNLSRQIEESRKLAMKHISMASKIDEEMVQHPSKKVYGITYDFQGKTASDYQFFLTDSTAHFIRGALYFNINPNKDSLAPVIEYIQADVEHLIETFEWTDTKL